MQPARAATRPIAHPCADGGHPRRASDGHRVEAAGVDAADSQDRDARNLHDLAQPTGAEQWICLDNAGLQETPSAAPLGTEYVESGATLPVAALRTNQ